MNPITKLFQKFLEKSLKRKLRRGDYIRPENWFNHRSKTFKRNKRKGL